MHGYKDEKGRFRKIDSHDSVIHSSDVHSNKIKVKQSVHGKPVIRLSLGTTHDLHSAIVNGDVFTEKSLLRRIGRIHKINTEGKKVKFLDDDGHLYLENENRKLPKHIA